MAGIMSTPLYLDEANESPEGRVLVITTVVAEMKPLFVRATV